MGCEKESCPRSISLRTHHITADFDPIDASRAHRTPVLYSLRQKIVWACRNQETKNESGTGKPSRLS